MTEKTNTQIAADNVVPEQVWAAAYERVVAAITGFKTYRRTPILTIQPEDLPCLSIYKLRDREQALGESVTLEPRFIPYLHLGISGMIAASDVDQQLAWVATQLQSVRIALYTDAKFIKLISGFESSDTRLMFSRVGETAVAEFQTELVIRLPESFWPPLVPDDFKMLHLTLQYPTPPHGAPVIERQWDIEQND